MGLSSSGGDSVASSSGSHAALAQVTSKRHSRSGEGESEVFKKRKVNPPFGFEKCVFRSSALNCNMATDT